MKTIYEENGVIYAENEERVLSAIGCNDSKAKTIVIKNGVTKIEKAAFEECEMEVVVLPDSLENIGQDSFYACRFLKEVHFGNGLRKIELYAFSMCNNLKSVMLPNSLLNVGYRAFDSIQEVTCQRYIDGLVESFADGLFEDLPYTVVINIGDFRMLMPRHLKLDDAIIKDMFNKDMKEDEVVSAYKKNIFRYDSFGGNCLMSAVEIFLDNPQNETAKKFIYEKEKAVVIQFLEKRYRPDTVIKLMEYCKFSNQTLQKFLEIAQEKTDIPFVAYVMRKLQKQKNSSMLKI